MDPVLALSVATASAAGALSLQVGLRRQKSELHWVLLALLAALVLWSVGIGARALVSEPGARRALLRVLFLGAFSTPGLWLLLAARHSPLWRRRGTRAIELAVMLPSLLAYLALLTNDVHHGIIRELRSDATGPHGWAGPLFWAFLAWAYVCALGGAAFLLHSARQAWRAGHPGHAAAMATVAALPVIATAATSLGPVSRDYPVAPAGILVAVLLMAATSLRYRLLVSVPIAHPEVIEQLRDGVLVADRRGGILDHNPAAAALLGCSGDALHRATLASVLTEVAAAEERASLQQRLEHLEGSPGAERIALRTSDGRRLEVRVASIRTGAGEPAAGLLAVLRDRTEELRYAEIVQRTQKLETVGTLAAGIAHEVNNPLAYVRANLGQLAAMGERVLEARDEGPSKLAEDLLDLREMAEEALEGIDRIERIVADMRRLSAAPGEGFVSIDVNDLVHHAVRLTRLRCGRSVRLECRLGESLPRIDGSPQLLAQALLNLLVNACQAVEDATEPHVCIETAAEGEGALIRVRDRGHGIPEAERPHVFEPFFTTREDRTGLGLSIARDIVADHAGCVELEGRPDGWTTFAVRLPAPGT